MNVGYTFFVQKFTTVLVAAGRAGNCFLTS